MNRYSAPIETLIIVIGLMVVLFTFAKCAGSKDDHPGDVYSIYGSPGD